jgi:hypothetical protein
MNGGWDASREWPAVGRARRGPDFTFLICDRDTKFTDGFGAVFHQAEGIRIIRTPIQAPRANAIMETLDGQRALRLYWRSVMLAQVVIALLTVVQ